MRILLVEDYPPLKDNITECLVEEGYAVDATSSGEEGLWYAANHNYDVIILDIMLPEISGLEILQRIRAKGDNVPLILISARDEITDRIEGLETGADDYLVKPFALEELVARVRAQIRRKHGQKRSVLSVGDLALDTASKTVTRAGREIPLTRMEYRLLECLAFKKDEVVSRDYIWQHVYDDYEGGSSNTVDVYIGYLRKKLKVDGLEDPIVTKRGFGYLLSSAAA
jgi:DNA-binding response OmpR family regulator